MATRVESGASNFKSAGGVARGALGSALGRLIQGVPMPIAGVALGVVALGNLLQPVAEPLHAACGVLALGLLLLLVAKLASFPHMMADDMRHPIFCSVSATFFMTVMQLATYVQPICHGLALAMWWAAVVCHAALIVWFTALAVARFRLSDVYPTYFICYVGIVVGSVTSASVGMLAAGRAILCFGLPAYAVMLVLVTWRYARCPVAEPARPLFCIYAAPMSLSLAGYLSTHAQPSLTLVVVLEALAQLLLLVVLLRLPSLLRLRFYPSYAAMTFPFVITATALSKTVDVLAAAGAAVPAALGALLVAETLLAACMVCYVLVRYVAFLAGCCRPAPDAAVAPGAGPIEGAVARR